MTRLLLLGLALAAIACAAHVAPIAVLLVHPVFTQHDVTSWLDDDEVCVLLPANQALYITRSCLSVRAIRSLILATRVANQSE